LVSPEQYFAAQLLGLFGLIALVYLVSLPADVANAIFLGFPARRMALAAAMLLPTAGFSVLSRLSFRPGWRARWLAD